MFKRTFSVTITEEEENKLREEASRSEILRQACAFDRKIGVMVSIELHRLGITSDTFGGSFANDRLTELKEFCKRNSWAHIVSQKKGVLYNRVVDDADSYSLGDGDPDSTLRYPEDS